MISSALLRRRLMATSLLFFVMTVSAERISAQQKTKPLEPADLELVISGPLEDFPDRPPREYHARMFKVALLNHSSRPVVFGPNALEAIRSYETTDWRVMDASGNPVPYRTLFICRVSSVRVFQARPLTDADLFVIPAGASRELADLNISMWFKLSEPGEYKIYREFSFSPPRLSQVTIGGMKYPSQYDASAMSPEKRQILSDAIGFTIRSNVWTLVIK
ncbi:MAG TPA: hypothetical protein VIX91_11530 [Candidatus Acidoferrum sp.]